MRLILICIAAAPSHVPLWGFSKTVLDNGSCCGYNTHMVKILFKHWKTGQVLEVSGEILFDHPQSDRIVVRQEDGELEDIIKETIISIEL